MLGAKRPVIDDALRDLQRLAVERQAAGGDTDAFAVAAMSIGAAILTRSMTGKRVKRIAFQTIEHWTNVRGSVLDVGSGVDRLRLK